VHLYLFENPSKYNRLFLKNKQITHISKNIIILFLAVIIKFGIFVDTKSFSNVINKRRGKQIFGKTNLDPACRVWHNRWHKAKERSLSLCKVLNSSKLHDETCVNSDKSKRAISLTKDAVEFTHSSDEDKETKNDKQIIQ